MPDEPVPLGSAVRAARASAGLSVAQVSAITRIRVGILEDLEAGRTASCGGRVYVRGHLRAIADATVTDPEVLLTAYERQSAPGAGDVETARTGAAAPRRGREAERGPGRPAAAADGADPTAGARPARAASGPQLPGRPVRVSTGAPARPPAGRPGRTRASGPAARPARRPAPSAASGSLLLPSTAAPERSGPRWGVALGVVSAGLLALIGVGLLQGAPDEGVDPAPVTAAASSPTPSAVVPIPVDPSAVARVPSPTGAALRLRVVDGSSWVNVSGTGGRTLFRGVLREGTARDFTDRQRLRVTVGDAGAVSLICSGKDAPEGRSGQVKRYTCAKDGFAAS